MKCIIKVMHLFAAFLYSDWSETMKCYIATAFQLHCGIFYLEGPVRLGGTGNWN
jgi:hypothetical protein